eukprot:748942-Hanusia_phi.AAC.1
MREFNKEVTRRSRREQMRGGGGSRGGGGGGGGREVEEGERWRSGTRDELTLHVVQVEQWKEDPEFKKLVMMPLQMK